MTVIVGIIARNGAIMAADTEATESGHTRYDVEKIWECQSLLFGYTGSTVLKQPIERAVTDAITSSFRGRSHIPRLDAQAIIAAAAKNAMMECFVRYAGNVPAAGPLPPDLNGALLVMGHDASGYWMVEFDARNMATDYTGNGFHSIGSGSAAAYTAKSLMTDYYSIDSELLDVKLIAHRTVKNCIDSLGGGHGVGGKINLWVINESGPAQLTTTELESVTDGVAKWRLIERESLAKVNAPETQEESAESLPEPFVEDQSEAAADEETDKQTESLEKTQSSFDENPTELKALTPVAPNPTTVRRKNQPKAKKRRR